MTIEQINEVCSDRYGCGILAIDPIGALWVADVIQQQRGVNVYGKIAARRRKFGKTTAFPTRGTPVFETM